MFRLAYSGLYARVIRNTYTTEYAESRAPVLTGYLQGSGARDIVGAALVRESDVALASLHSRVRVN